MADFEVVSVEMHNCREGEQDKTDRCLPYFQIYCQLGQCLVDRLGGYED